MPTISIIQENPNPQLVSYAIDADYMAGLGKLVFTKTGALQQYSPLAQALFKGGVTRVDFSFEDGKTFITLSKKITQWNQAEKDNILNYLAQSLGRTPVFTSDLMQHAELRRPFDPGSNGIKKLISNIFNNQVKTRLASHGGSMEIEEIDIEKNGHITIHTALLGSCNNCGMAPETTLASAFQIVNTNLIKVKENYADNPSIQLLELQPIQIAETVSDLVYSR